MSEREALAGLVARARDGDLEAFDGLVRRFQDMAVGYAYSLLNDFGAAEDAAQEAFIQLHADLPTLRAPEAFISWFRRIIFKQCDRLRRGKRPALVPLDARLPTGEGQPVAVVEAHEAEARLRRALAGLPEAERAALVLFHLQDASLKDLTEFLGLSRSAADHRLRQARQHLKEGLLTMLNHDLQANRPSNDTRFLRRVMDSLTGLSNKQGFSTRLTEEFEISRATGQGFGLGLLDLDDYGGFNATHGHLAADALLAALAKQFQSRLNPAEFVARYGGDELAVIVRRGSLREAWTLLDDFRRTVSEAEYRLSDLLRPEARTLASGGEADGAAEHEFQTGVRHLRANALAEAQAAFERALAADPHHAASEMELAFVNGRLTLDPAVLAAPFHVTITGGLASYRADDTPDSLIARADALMSQAKATRRDQVLAES